MNITKKVMSHPSLRELTRVRYCYCEASVWLLCISSVGCSVRSYVCADLLSTREGSPSKGGLQEPMEPPLDPPLVIKHFTCHYVSVLHNIVEVSLSSKNYLRVN